jgi:hypothetical protein
MPSLVAILFLLVPLALLVSYALTLGILHVFHKQHEHKPLIVTILFLSSFSFLTLSLKLLNQNNTEHTYNKPNTYIPEVVPPQVQALPKPTNEEPTKNNISWETLKEKS